MRKPDLSNPFLVNLANFKYNVKRFILSDSQVICDLPVMNFHHRIAFSTMFRADQFVPLFGGITNFTKCCHITHFF